MLALPTSAVSAPRDLQVAVSTRAAAGYDSNVYYGATQLLALPEQGSAALEVAPGLEIGLASGPLRFDLTYGAAWRQSLADTLEREGALDHTIELRAATASGRGVHLEVSGALTQLTFRRASQAGWIGAGGGAQLAWSWGDDRKLGLDYLFSQLWYREDTRERRHTLRPTLRWRVLGGLAMTFGYPLTHLRAEPSGLEHGPWLMLGWSLPGLPLRAQLGYQLSIQHITDGPNRIDLYHIPQVEVSYTAWGWMQIYARYAATLEPGGHQHLALGGLGVALDFQTRWGDRPKGDPRGRVLDALSRAGADAETRRALLTLAKAAEFEVVLPALREALSMESARELLDQLRERLGRGEDLHSAAHAIVDLLQRAEGRAIGARRRR